MVVLLLRQFRKLNKIKKEGEKVMSEKVIHKIKKAQRVVSELTRLALEIGTFLAVIKMIIQSLS